MFPHSQQYNYDSTDLYRRTTHEYEQVAPLDCAFNNGIPCACVEPLPTLPGQLAPYVPSAQYGYGLLNATSLCGVMPGAPNQ